MLSVLSSLLGELDHLDPVVDHRQNQSRYLRPLCYVDETSGDIHPDMSAMASADVFLVSDVDVSVLDNFK